MNANTRKRLEQILMFAIRIQRVMKSTSLDKFLSNEDIQDAVLYRLGQIGEEASKIPDEEQERYPELFWDGMIGLRHRLFHEYCDINLSRVYDITQQPTNSLIDELNTILSNNH